MYFELDEILSDEILFHMENQDGDFLLDTQERKIIDMHNDAMKNNETGKNNRFIPLPEWCSGDGYRLMEKFTAMLKNPFLRQELSSALNKTRGVFRAFKSAIEQYPETEKQWFRFKKQTMKNELISWYNSLREEWGLEKAGIEPEDTSSLVLEDFIIKELNDFNFSAEASGGELAGSVSAKYNGSFLHINSLEVKNEYQGMGLGKTLLARLLEKADEQKLDVTIDLPAETDFFSRALLLENFKPLMQRFKRETE